MRSISMCFVASCATLLAVCAPIQVAHSAKSVQKEVAVNGAKTRHLQQGDGPTVVFVHGEFSDHRFWDGQREAVARNYRFVALDLRYFGTAAWPDNGSLFSPATHTEDLATFIRSLKVGAVHLVGTSYGAGVSLAVTARSPDLVRSLFINEYPMPSMVNDYSYLQASAADRDKARAVVAAAKTNDSLRATQLLLDRLTGRPNAYEALSQDRRTIIRENARTTPLLIAAPPPATLTCLQAGQLRIPVAITMGQRTSTAAKIIAEATHRCIPSSQLISIADATHIAPWENTSEFNTALLTFLARQQ